MHSSTTVTFFSVALSSASTATLGATTTSCSSTISITVNTIINAFTNAKSATTNGDYLFNMKTISGLQRVFQMMELMVQVLTRFDFSVSGHIKILDV